MPDYDFRSLSSHDFELLARDLLQEELKVRLESFSAGPDSGIDFRHRTHDSNLIVQCKHYVDSGFPRLAGVLSRKERPKIEKLEPTEYILATSVPLNRDRKDKILEILKPYCSDPGEIYGPDDLNNLLGRHSEVERRHFKLWLTSEPVLQRVLNAGIFSATATHLEQVRLRLCRYVPNPSFSRARSLLEKSHYCIIAGIPGIGKTTLAEVLLADLVDRHAFEAFRIAHSLDEIRPVKNSKRKQVFYFDDFLGTTTLDTLQKNEDRHLIELIEEVASNPNWRFILTTREYILNRAKSRYEALAQPHTDLTLCVIQLNDYTWPIRAKILYNHIYFSQLPKAHKLALLQDRAYSGILTHANYNPRVVEYMTDPGHACTVAPSLYAKEFTDSLDHPARIWDHAFRHQISDAARHILLVLSTMPEDALLDDAEAAFWSFYRFRQKRFGFASSSQDWTNGLKELDGNFVTTKRVGPDTIISFHSPSIRDFVEDFLSGTGLDVLDLIRSAHFYEQYVTLWEGRQGRRYPAVRQNHADFLDHLRRGIFGPTASTIRHVYGDGEPIGQKHRNISYESRAQFAVRVAQTMHDDVAEAFLKDTVSALKARWTEGTANKGQ